MELTIELPNMERLSEVNDAYLKEMLAANLYYQGKLSEKEAREILGLTRREFEKLLPRFGFSIIADTPENIAVELDTK